jgi:uncharacterized membrane protein
MFVVLGSEIMKRRGMTMVMVLLIISVANAIVCVCVCTYTGWPAHKYNICVYTSIYLQTACMCDVCMYRRSKVYIYINQQDAQNSCD